MAKTRKKPATHLSEVDLLKIQIRDLNEIIKQRDKTIEEMKLADLAAKEVVMQTKMKILHYEKVLQRQSVTAAEKSIDDQRKAKVALFNSLRDSYSLPDKWGYDEDSGEISRNDEE